MSAIFTICRRELGTYFRTPIAYVFLLIFLNLSSVSTFYFGNFFERDQADLYAFFQFHPWLYLFFLPALAMRSWSEERRSGTIELLATLPLHLYETVIGKFLASWLFTALALLLTTPLWLSVNYLGTPDNGVILASYIGSLLMAGGYLAIGMLVSAFTKNQVIAFVLTLIVCLGFILSGFPVVIDLFSAWAPPVILDTIRTFSFLTHFEDISKGVIDLRDIIYFLSLITFCLYSNVLVLDLKKAD